MPLTHKAISGKASLALASLTLLGLAASPSAHAQIFYSDRTSFNSASSNVTTLTFENLIGTSAFPNNYGVGTGYAAHDSSGISLDGLNFVGASNGYGYETYFLGPDASGGDYSLNGTTSLLGGRASLTVTLPPGTTSFGTDIGQDHTKASYSDPITIDAQVTLANSQSYTQVLNLTAGSTAFLGFTAASPIADVTFTNPNDPLYSLHPYAIYDNVSFGPSTPVPEASTLVSTGLLLCLGLSAVAWNARRKKAQAGE